VKNPAQVTRAEAVEGLSAAMNGRSWGARGGFLLRPGSVRTFAVEVNATDGTEALERAGRFAFELGLRMLETADAALGFAYGEKGSLVIDTADERFWQIHATGATGWLEPALQSRISRSVDLDWCWLPQSDISALQRRGQTRWFKSDFRGDELLAQRGVKARRLKVQLEGDDADELRQHIANLAGYGQSTALTGVAIDVLDKGSGSVREATHYRGGFKGSGDSFEAHQAFVGAAIERYGNRIRRVESEMGIRWHVDADHGARFDGQVVEIALRREIQDLDHFASVLFSCRDPFRLWAVPTREGPDYIEAEAVDLHVGQPFAVDILPNSLRLYLHEGVCANTVFRLLANLQHRFDASAVARTTDAKLA
jgi:hypothetical protein